MLRQFLVGGGVSLVTIAFHALAMTFVVQVARAMGTKQQSHSSLVLIAVRFSSDGRARPRSIRMGFGVLDLRCRARRGRSRLFCVCELHDTRLRRRASGGTLAASWRHNRDDRHVAIWMVGRGHFRGATANFGAHARSQRLTTLQSHSCEGHAKARLARFLRCYTRKLRAGDSVNLIVRIIGSDI